MSPPANLIRESQQAVMRHPIELPLTDRILNAGLRLLRCKRGSGDLTVALLLTAAGAAMVGLTVPTLFKSSDTAARTFDKQVQILERGAGGAGGGTPSLQTGAGGGVPGLPGGFEMGTPGGISAPAKGSTALTTPAATSAAAKP
jgi:hypothetical protein